MFATWGRRKSPRGRRTSLLTRNLQLWVKMINILEYYVASEERKLSKTFRNLLLMLASVEITGVFGQTEGEFVQPPKPAGCSLRQTHDFRRRRRRCFEESMGKSPTAKGGRWEEAVTQGSSICLSARNCIKRKRRHLMITNQASCILSQVRNTLPRLKNSFIPIQCITMKL